MDHLSSAETRALNELHVWLRQRFSERLREVTLFGSRARGEGDEDSDLDVAVIVDDLGWREAREVADVCGDLLTRYDVLVSPFALSGREMNRLRQRERFIARELSRDGIRL